MRPVTLYQFDPRQIIQMPVQGAYLTRDCDAEFLSRTQVHNPEWYIQQKIEVNEEGFFDFSKNMIDIGACFGTYSFVLPFQYSYMFEPNKEYLAYCHINMALHGKSWQADIYNLAVGNENCMIKFDGFKGGDLANPHGHAWTETSYMEVPCVRLDDMKDKIKNVGFIKIDIEGMEPYAIMGAQELIRENDYPPILFESWEEGNTEETPEHRNYRVALLKAVLDELGYEILWEWGDEINHLAVHR